MNGICSTNGGNINICEIFVENLKERNQSGYLYGYNIKADIKEKGCDNTGSTVLG
jgi:hypothetical protein